MVESSEKLLLQVTEVVALTGLSRSMVYDLISTNQIPSIRVSEKAIRVPRAGLEAWITAKQQEAKLKAHGS